MEGQKVALTGVPLASLLRAVAAVEKDFDGFLIGKHVNRTISTMHDDRGDEVSDVLEVHISGFLSNAGLGTFYSYGGLVDDRKVQEVLATADGTLVGWFVAREGTLLSPTMRDLAVTVSLQQALQRLGIWPGTTPLLFMAVAWTRDASTITSQHRLHRLSAGPSPSLHPVTIEIANLGPWRSRGAYKPLLPTTFWGEEDGESGAQGRKPAKEEFGQSLHDVLQDQGLGKYLVDVHDVEDMYIAAVQKVLEMYEGIDSVEAAEVSELEGEVHRLLEAL